MKKSVCLVILLIAIGIIGLIVYNSRIKYPSGKDTLMSFGDGTFQIGKVNNHRPMSYAPVGVCIIDNVTDVYETKTKVYIIGEHISQKQKVFAIIDLDENTVLLYEELRTENTKEYWTESNLIAEGVVTRVASFADFSQEDQTVFQDRGRFDTIRN